MGLGRLIVVLGVVQMYKYVSTFILFSSHGVVFVERGGQKGHRINILAFATLNVLITQLLYL